MKLNTQVGQSFNPEWLDKGYDELIQLYMVSDPKSISPELHQRIWSRLKETQPNLR